MSEIEKLTADHKAALERLDLHERSARKTKRWLATALITALGTGGGTVAKQILDYRQERRRIEIQAGAEAKAAELEAVQWGEASEALEAIDAELEARARRLAELETRIAKAEVAIDFLTADQRWIRRTADRRVEDAPAPSPARKSIKLPDYGDLRADPERIQQRKAKILDALE